MYPWICIKQNINTFFPFTSFVSQAFIVCWNLGYYLVLVPSRIHQLRRKYMSLRAQLVGIPISLFTSPSVFRVVPTPDVEQFPFPVNPFSVPFDVEIFPSTYRKSRFLFYSYFWNLHCATLSTCIQLHSSLVQPTFWYGFQAPLWQKHVIMLHVLLQMFNKCFLACRLTIKCLTTTHFKRVRDGIHKRISAFKNITTTFKDTLMS